MPNLADFLGMPPDAPASYESAGWAGSGAGLVYGTAVTTGNGVKGSWVQLIASTTKKTVAMLLMYMQDPTFGGYDIVLDIGTGAAASEVVLVPDLYSHLSGMTGGTWTYLILGNIPAGTRVAVRGRGSGLTLWCGIGLMETD